MSKRVTELSRWQMLERPNVHAVVRLARVYRNVWRDRSDAYWFRRLREEVSELADAIIGRHEDPPDWELLQIASICMNWLDMRNPEGYPSMLLLSGVAEQVWGVNLEHVSVMRVPPGTTHWKIPIIERELPATLDRSPTAEYRVETARLEDYLVEGNVVRAGYEPISKTLVVAKEH